MNFRKWVYHKDFEPRIVSSLEELLALGPGWEESPVDAQKDEPKKPKTKAKK
jgi:hypothetical protein